MYHGGPQVPIVSLGLVPELVSLQSLFNLLEVWGTVIYIKRNYHKPKVVTVKFVSLSDAENCVNNVKKVHIDDGDEHVSARLFGHFKDATFQEPTDEGDPNDAATCQGYNFSSAKHRSSAQRCRNPPSEILKLLGAGEGHEPEAIAARFDSLGLPVPISVTAHSELAPSTNNTADGGADNAPQTISSYLLTFTQTKEAIKALMGGTDKVGGALVFAPTAQNMNNNATSSNNGASYGASSNGNSNPHGDGMMMMMENGDSGMSAAEGF